MQAKSIKGTTAEEIKSALQQSMADGLTPVWLSCDDYKPTVSISTKKVMVKLR